MNVVAVKPEEFKNAKGEDVTRYWVTFEGRAKPVPCYDARAKDFTIGQPLPDGWDVANSKAGNDYLKAPQGERKAAWANTEEGLKYVQERMDRRTALMQAILGGWKDVGGIIVVAEQLYEWLRKNLDVPEGPRIRGRESLGSAGVGGQEPSSTQGPPSGTSGDDHPPLTQSSPETPEGGQGPASPPSRRDCTHPETRSLARQSDGRMVKICTTCGLKVGVE